MVIEEIKRLSFKSAWRLRMNDEQRDAFKFAYLHRYSIGTFYNDKNGVSNIPKERQEFIEGLAGNLNIENIWD